MAYSRANIEVLLFMICRAIDLLSPLNELLNQARAYLEHLRWGGDPGEWRRNKWLTVASRKQQYKPKGAK
jgi:hypothetical protein